MILLLAVSAASGFGQSRPVRQAAEDPIAERIIPVDSLSKDSSGGDRFVALPARATCKTNRISWFLITRKQPLSKVLKPKKEAPARSPLITVHGNIQYEFDYWSTIDTPYAEKNVNQQTLSTYLDVNYRNEYPFRVFFTTRWNNSSFFKNFTDLNFLYNAADFNNRVRRQVKKARQPIQKAGQSALLVERPRTIAATCRRTGKAMVEEAADGHAPVLWFRRGFYEGTGTYFSAGSFFDAVL
jgi:hypothetical protein